MAQAMILRVRGSSCRSGFFCEKDFIATF
jgi:hypothetical protein